MGGRSLPHHHDQGSYVATDYSVGDRDHWVAVARKRGWMISKLIKEKEALEDEVRKLKQEREVDVRD